MFLELNCSQSSLVLLKFYEESNAAIRSAIDFDPDVQLRYFIKITTRCDS